MRQIGWAHTRILRLGSEDGASLVEYALLLLFISVVAIVVIANLGDTTSASFDSVVDQGFSN